MLEVNAPIPDKDKRRTGGFLHDFSTGWLRRAISIAISAPIYAVLAATVGPLPWWVALGIAAVIYLFVSGVLHVANARRERRDPMDGSP
jgi:hypothetical protein